VFFKSLLLLRLALLFVLRLLLLLLLLLLFFVFVLLELLLCCCLLELAYFEEVSDVLDDWCWCLLVDDVGFFNLAKQSGEKIS